jgi:hypothetical protein
MMLHLGRYLSSSVVYTVVKMTVEAGMAVGAFTFAEIGCFQSLLRGMGVALTWNRSTHDVGRWSPQTRHSCRLSSRSMLGSL